MIEVKIDRPKPPAAAWHRTSESSVIPTKDETARHLNRPMNSVASRLGVTTNVGL
jgi:hypothetical protein